MIELRKLSIPPYRAMFSDMEELKDHLINEIEEATEVMSINDILKTNSGCGYLVFIDGRSYDEINNSWRK